MMLKEAQTKNLIILKCKLEVHFCKNQNPNKKITVHLKNKLLIIHNVNPDQQESQKLKIQLNNNKMSKMIDK